MIVILGVTLVVFIIAVGALGCLEDMDCLLSVLCTPDAEVERGFIDGLIIRGFAAGALVAEYFDVVLKVFC